MCISGKHLRAAIAQATPSSPPPSELSSLLYDVVWAALETDSAAPAVVRFLYSHLGSVTPPALDAMSDEKAGVESAVRNPIDIAVTEPVQSALVDVLWLICK